MNKTARKLSLKDHFSKIAPQREAWLKKNATFYSDDRAYSQFLIPSKMKILDVGCGTGELLSQLNPSIGVGIDFDPTMIAIAKQNHPDLKFVVYDIECRNNNQTLVNEKFDFIILSDLVCYLEDCQETLTNLHKWCHKNTRLVISYHAWHWEPILKLAERVRLKMPSLSLNWMNNQDFHNFLCLSDFEIIKRDQRQLVPIGAFGLEKIINNTVGTLPFIRDLSLRHYIIARPLRRFKESSMTASIIIPCKNEKGNIENAIKRIPQFARHIEIIFVEGNSSDGTAQEIERVKKKYVKHDIKFLKQDGVGKGDAVRKGFDAASGDILMILDADLTVPPEDLPKFYHAIASGKAEFVNGTRLVYPMADQAMRFLNYIANRIFSLIFSWLLNQRFTDTLCGTKVITRKNYNLLAKNREYFGDFDPFGDFDLIFGASKLNLKILEVPIRYAARNYGETQISRFKHGWLLLKMVVFAYWKLKVLKNHAGNYHTQN